MFKHGKGWVRGYKAIATINYFYNKNFQIYGSRFMYSCQQGKYYGVGGNGVGRGYTLISYNKVCIHN